MSKLILVLTLLVFTFSDGDRYLVWNADEPISWDDFQGPPNPNTEMKAHTKSRIDYSWKCEAGVFQAKVSATFDRERSWKKEPLTDYLLAHEQLHFDITEMYARQLRKVFTLLEDPCTMSADEINEIANQVRAQWKGIQAQYDLQSDHGRDEMGQLVWNTQVEKGLEELGEYRDQ